MDHSIKLLTSEKLSHTFTIGQINFVKTEQGDCSKSKVRLFKIDVVVVHIVDTDNLMTRLQKALARVKADES